MTTAPSLTYPLSLHDALPISRVELSIDRPPRGSLLCTKASRTRHLRRLRATQAGVVRFCSTELNSLFAVTDRKSTRLNSSHVEISYAVFCLKKKNACGHSIPA